jgi:hypothetical protein
MPNVLVETRGGWLGAKRAAFLDAIQAATVEALRMLRLIEHPKECFAIPPETAEQYTHIVIVMFAGRSLSAKRALYQAIVRHLEPFGVPPGDVRIIQQEVPRENVGMQGGKAAVRHRRPRVFVSFVHVYCQPVMADEALIGEHALLVSRRSDHFAG